MRVLKFSKTKLFVALRLRGIGRQAYMGLLGEAMSFFGWQSLGFTAFTGCLTRRVYRYF
jgi:hypothetical protein